MKNPKYTLIAHSSVAAMFLGLTPACALEDDESIEDLERFAIVDSTSSADEQELFEQIGRLKMEVEWLKKKSAELA